MFACKVKCLSMQPVYTIRSEQLRYNNFPTSLHCSRTSVLVCERLSAITTPDSRTRQT